jgi:hypothetical protein
MCLPKSNHGSATTQMALPAPQELNVNLVLAPTLSEPHQTASTGLAPTLSELDRPIITGEQAIDTQQLMMHVVGTLYVVTIPSDANGI